MPYDISIYLFYFLFAYFLTYHSFFFSLNRFLHFRVHLSFVVGCHPRNLSKCDLHFNFRDSTCFRLKIDFNRLQFKSHFNHGSNTLNVKVHLSCTRFFHYQIYYNLVRCIYLTSAIYSKQKYKCPVFLNGPRFPFIISRRMSALIRSLLHFKNVHPYLFRKKHISPKQLIASAKRNAMSKLIFNFTVQIEHSRQNGSFWLKAFFAGDSFN